MQDSTQTKSKYNKTIIVGGYDNITFFTVLTLVLFGVVMIFSSSYYAAATSSKWGNDMFYFIVKQSLAVGLGFIAMLVMSAINYERLKGLPIFLGYLVSNALLIYVKFFGQVINGARRWIRIPVFGSFQPSELAKIMVILLLAYYISEDKNRVRTPQGLAVCAAIALLPCTLVFWGNNLSTAIIIAAIAFCMVFVSSPYFLPFIGLAGAAVAALVAYLTLSDGFRSERFAVWKNPFIDPQDRGYQTIQSLYAVASGGLFGLGLGKSHQKLIFMPEPFNDFIFAVVCEELGFFGATILLILFVVLIWRGVVISMKAKDLFGSLIALGITVMIAVQVIINVAVVTNTIPNTGIPMPFISYGGTSIVFVMAGMGVLLNISRYRNKSQ